MILNIDIHIHMTIAMEASSLSLFHQLMLEKIQEKKNLIRRKCEVLHNFMIPWRTFIFMKFTFTSTCSLIHGAIMIVMV